MKILTYILFCVFICLSAQIISLTYFYGDGSYFRGVVDAEGRPREGVQYDKEGTVKYNGSWVDGRYQGTGSWYGVTGQGEEYHGQWWRGEPGGRGVLSFGKAGERVEGKFEEGRVSGEAVWYRPSKGVRLEGMFKRGHAHGPGVVVWEDTGYR